MNHYNSTIHNRRSIRLKGYDYTQAGMYFVTICCQDRFCRFGKIVNGEMILNEYGKIAFNEWHKLADRFHNFELDVFQIMPNHIHGIIALSNVGAGFTPALNNGIGINGNGVTPALNNNIDPNNDIGIIGNGFTPALNNGIGINGTGDTPTLNNNIDPKNDIGDIIGNGFTPALNNGIGINGTGVNPAPTAVSDIVGAYKSLVANECLKIHKSRNEIMGKFWQRNYFEHIIRNEKAYDIISNYIVNNPIKWDEDKFYV